MIAIDTKVKSPTHLKFGQVVTWGSGECDQMHPVEKQNSILLEDSDFCLAKAPVVLENIKKAASPSAGSLHSACINEDQDILIWGCNDDNIHGNDESGNLNPDGFYVKNVNNNAVSLACGNLFTACLCLDGTCQIWGAIRTGNGFFHIINQTLQHEFPIVKITCGYNHIMCLLYDNEACNFLIYGFGSNEFGQLCKEEALEKESTEENFYTKHSLMEDCKPTIINIPERNLLVDIFSGANATIIKCVSINDNGPKFFKYFGTGQNSTGELAVDLDDNVELNIFHNWVPLTNLDGYDFIDIQIGDLHSLGLTKDKVLMGWGHPEYLNKEGDIAITKPTLITQKSFDSSLDLEDFISNPKNRIKHFTLSGRSVIYENDDSNLFGFGDSQTGQFFKETDELLKNVYLKELTNVQDVKLGSQHGVGLMEPLDTKKYEWQFLNFKKSHKLESSSGKEKSNKKRCL